MKYLKHFIFGLFFISPVLLSSCDPDEPNCVVQCESVNTAPQELLDYFMFNEGSFWVYQLNGTDTFDTLAFAGVYSEFFELLAGCNHGIPPCQMRYSIYYNHSNRIKFPKSQNTVNERFYIDFSEGFDQWVVEHVSGNGGVSDLGDFLAYPFKINQQFTQFRFLKDTASTITVPAGTFVSLETEMRPNPSSSGFIQSMHWSKNIGLIRYEISPDQTWELVNYIHQ